MKASPAAAITRTASKQAYFTIRFLADRDRVEDAFRSYAYMRWVDDVLDADSSSEGERRDFLTRQQNLVEDCLRGRAPRPGTAQEELLVELVHHDDRGNTGLRCYLRTMMQLMEFDARRRGRLISSAELSAYTRWLAVAVTENMHHFIGHWQAAPQVEARYLAVSAAHITHMLRDTFEDVHNGYFNIPREFLEAHHIGPRDVDTTPYRAWVKQRVQQARQWFLAGRQYLAGVHCVRFRVAVLAYTARFEWVLDTLEREDYEPRAHYAERKTAGAAIRMACMALASLIMLRGARSGVARGIRPLGKS